MNEEAQRLKDLISKKEMSVLAFAKHCNVTPTVLYALFDGRTKLGNISVGNFIKIARGLDMTTDELHDVLFDGEPFLKPTHDKPLSPAEKAFNSLTAEKKEAFMRLMDG